jgi:hippurate hydrolase
MEALVQLRHHLHQHPETAYLEFETAKTLKAALVNAGFQADQFVDCAISGFYVDIIGTGAESAHALCIALRTDMDALKMQEANTDLPYCSVNDGAAHMCGHDGHMASLIGAAINIKQQQSAIPSNCRVRLLFQPAEEGALGAVKMVEAGCLEGVDEVYGVHNMPNQSLGQVYCPDGPIMAAFLVLNITIKGRGGHGAYPEKCQDVVLAMSQTLSALATLTSRSISCHESAVFTICKVVAGSAINVMPSEATLAGTLRSYSTAVKETLLGRIRTVITSIAAAYDCTAELEILCDCPPTINHKAQAEFVREAAAETFGSDLVISDFPSSASEDFAYYLLEKPGAFIFVYSGQPKVLHSTDYNFSDELIPCIGRLYISILSKRFGVKLSYNA